MLIYTTVNCAFSPAFALPWLPRQRFQQPACGVQHAIGPGTSPGMIVQSTPILAGG